MKYGGNSIQLNPNRVYCAWTWGGPL